MIKVKNNVLKSCIRRKTKSTFLKFSDLSNSAKMEFFRYGKCG